MTGKVRFDCVGAVQVYVSQLQVCTMLTVQNYICIRCMVMVNLFISHNLQCLVVGLMVIVGYIGPYGTFANSSEQEGLKQLISSG